MGLFKNMRDLKDLSKQAKAMGDQAMTDAGMRKGFMGAPKMSDAIAQMNSMMGDVQQMQSNSVLLQTGVPGAGVVAGLADTGMEVNNNRVVELTLDVTAEGAEPYRTTLREAVSPVMMPQIQFGRPVPIRIDPADRDRVTLDWARLGQV